MPHFSLISRFGFNHTHVSDMKTERSPRSGGRGLEEGVVDEREDGTVVPMDCNIIGSPLFYMPNKLFLTN